MSNRQLIANQANAQKSTGPKTVAGKAAASGNATRHGMLSSRLFLPDEDPDEFAALAMDLQATLRPVGTMELALVEKIAIGMWRQRRLIAAETGALELARRCGAIASAVSDEMGLGYSSQLSEDDLHPADEANAKWCQNVIGEICAAEQTNIETLAEVAPLVWAQLKSEADEDKEPVAQYLDQFEDGLIGYMDNLLRWCRKELEKVEKRPVILAIAENMRAKKLVLPQRQQELLARYQTTLDNQLYKALRALRDAQAWRMKTLDCAATLADQGDEIAA